MGGMKNIPMILGALATLVAIGGGLIGVPIWVQNVVAQEAQKAATEAVEEQLDEKLAATVREMSSVKAAVREQTNFTMQQACMEKKSESRCLQEAQHRRASWLYADCLLVDTEEACAPVKPEPLPDP
jgi:hypothetical protein